MNKPLRIKQVSVIEVSDWDEFVAQTYGRPYNYQQQDGCQQRGTLKFSVPTPQEEVEDYENDSVPEEINGEEMGVSFKAWLARDPKQKPKEWESWALDLWWHRNFYPNFYMVVNDLHSKGLLAAGEYMIVIDW